MPSFTADNLAKLKQFRLVKVKNGKAIKDFPNMDALYKYLTMKDSLLNKPNLIDSSISVILAEQTSAAGLNSNKASLIKVEVLDNGTVSVSQGAYYTVTVKSSYWGSQGFPNFTVLSFQGTSPMQGIDLILIAQGSNVGDYSLSLTSKYGTSTSGYYNINITGIYQEIYSVGGIYRYTRAYNYSFKSTGSDYRFGMACTQNYVLIKS